MADYRCTICGTKANTILTSGPICDQHYLEVRIWSKALAEHLTAEAGGPVPVPLCPRRSEGLAGASVRTPDVYEYGHGLVSQTHIVMSCSFCGSMNPDDFVEAVLAGAKFEMAKHYKAYVHLPGGQAKFYTMHLSDEQRQRLTRI